MITMRRIHIYDAMMMMMVMITTTTTLMMMMRRRKRRRRRRVDVRGLVKKIDGSVYWLEGL